MKHTKEHYPHPLNNKHEAQEGTLPSCTDKNMKHKKGHYPYVLCFLSNRGIGLSIFLARANSKDSTTCHRVGRPFILYCVVHQCWNYIHNHSWMENYFVSLEALFIMQISERDLYQWSHALCYILVQSHISKTSKFDLFCDISITFMFIFFICGIYIICDSIPILLYLFDLDMTLSQKCDAI